MMAGIMDNEKAEMSTLAELILAQSTNADCLSVFASVRKLNTRFIVDSHTVLVLVSTLHGASQRVVPASIRSHLITVAITAFWPASQASVKCTTP